MSDVTDSLVKNWSKKARVSATNGVGPRVFAVFCGFGGWSSNTSLGLHRFDESQRPLFDIIFGGERREHGVERRKPERRAEPFDGVLADNASVLQDHDARADLLDHLEHVRTEHDYLAGVG